MFLPEIFKEVRYYEEKKIMQRFLYELGHDTGLATYGGKEAYNVLCKGIVQTLLISEEYKRNRVTIHCSNCDYMQQIEIKEKEPETIETEYNGKVCPNCSMPNLKVIEIIDVMRLYAELWPAWVLVSSPMP
jgi:peptide chain release factor subunit 1